MTMYSQRGFGVSSSRKGMYIFCMTFQVCSSLSFLGNIPMNHKQDTVINDYLALLKTILLNL